MKIERLEIKTINFEEQLEFYSSTMGLETRNKTSDSFEVIIGSSILKLTEDNKATPYHIAFHIPQGEIFPALVWVKERVEIQRNGNEEIVDFSAWKAMSLYFYDADKNILEFISRKDLLPPGEDSFTSKSFLGIAEIGLVTNNIAHKFNALNETIGLEKYDGNFENFCAIGDDEGLIITIDNNKKDWFPTHDKAFVSDFEMIIENKGQRYSLIYREDKLEITRVPQ